MLIDKIIIKKFDQSPSDFTGGNIQISVSKYTKQISIKLVLYFGFDFNRNTISRQIEIQESDISTITKELLIKAKNYKNNLITGDVLNIDEIVKDSYECTTNENEVVRSVCSDSDKGDRVDSDRVDSDKQTKTHLPHKAKAKKPSTTNTILQWIDENFTDELVDISKEFVQYRTSIDAPCKTIQSVTLFMNEAIHIHDTFGLKMLEREILRMQAGGWKTLYPEYKKGTYK